MDWRRWSQNLKDMAIVFCRWLCLWHMQGLLRQYMFSLTFTIFDEGNCKQTMAFSLLPPARFSRVILPDFRWLLQFNTVEGSEGDQQITMVAERSAASVRIDGKEENEITSAGETSISAAQGPFLSQGCLGAFLRVGLFSNQCTHPFSPHASVKGP